MVLFTGSTQKKVSDIPVPRREVTYQSLPGGNVANFFLQCNAVEITMASKTDSFYLILSIKSIVLKKLKVLGELNVVSFIDKK